MHPSLLEKVIPLRASIFFSKIVYLIPKIVVVLTICRIVFRNRSDFARLLANISVL